MAMTDSAGAPSGTRVRTGERRGFLTGTTEARPGMLTTEYWLTVLSAATLVIAGYISDAFPVRLAWALFAGVIAAYVLSRGFAKSGSREGPFILGSDGGQEPR